MYHMRHRPGLRIPTPLLYGGILVVATVGAWSVHRSAGDVLALAAIGALGFGLRHAGCPLAPVMIGVMLGPAADMHLRRALAIGEGNWTVLVTRPGSGALLLTAVVVLVGPALWRQWHDRRRAAF
jgi:putative tricarboxylic transport membrane protein